MHTIKISKKQGNMDVLPHFSRYLEGLVIAL